MRPMVSICGGEPLIYPKIEELVAGLLEQGRIVYVCTNGMFMRKKMRDYLASAYDRPEPTLANLLERKTDLGKGHRDHPQGQIRRTPGASARPAGCTGTFILTAWNTRTI